MVNAGWRTLKFSKTVFPRSVAAGVRFCSIICVQKVPLSVRWVSCKRDFLHDEVEPEVENTKIPLMPFEANGALLAEFGSPSFEAVIKQCHNLPGKSRSNAKAHSERIGIGFHILPPGSLQYWLALARIFRLIGSDTSRAVFSSPETCKTQPAVAANNSIKAELESNPSPSDTPS